MNTNTLLLERIFHALGDPTRREIYERVARKPQSVGELAAQLPITRPAVSQHLKVLKDAGLVKDTPVGTRHIYQADAQVIEAMRNWLDGLWTEALDNFAEFVNLNQETLPNMNAFMIQKSVTVNTTPERAFALFTQKIGAWWTKGETIGRGPHKDIVIEPKVGGRWYEIDSSDQMLQWGDVLAWEPPHRLLLAWRLNAQLAYDPNFETEVEITFKDTGTGTTEVRLEHRNFERFGQDAENIRAMLDSGWLRQLEQLAALISSEQTA